MKDVVRKFKNITHSVLGVVDLDTDIIERRREICGGCQFNSSNQGSEDLSIVDRIKDKVSPYCTVCGCIIKLKTTQSDEECALSDVGDIPKWGRVGYPVGDNRDIGIINNSSFLGTVKSVNKGYEFNFGDLDVAEDSFKFYFELLPISDVKILHVVVGCSHCSFIESQWVGDKLSCMVLLNLTGIIGSFNKSIFVTYKKGEDIKGLIIKYKGNYGRF